MLSQVSLSLHPLSLICAGPVVSPMKLSYSTQWEQYLTQEIVDEMNALVAYYNTKQATPEMKAVWKENIFFVNKLRNRWGKCGHDSLERTLVTLL
ncbi:uncharacterized protein LOC135337295 isoform X2 [Halichondria panicea]|uniref:uncharacterized protein LOC135337295 isoform X2 n=1 Tax=Halichondria panicea TaxID=6063 RepID=UPI00312BA7BD